MRIELRRKFPYYGKYKIKISVYNRSWYSLFVPNSVGVEKEKQLEVKEFLEKNWKEYIDYKWSDAWNVYLRDSDVFDSITANFVDYICTVHKPAPGFDHLVGVGKIEGRVVWYDKFPYKITLSNVDRNNNFTHIDWCSNNVDGDFRISSGMNETSFYFMTSFDAMAFKLAFSDNIKKTYVADKEKTKVILKERMETAIQEYHEYLEGEDDSVCKQ